MLAPERVNVPAPAYGVDLVYDDPVDVPALPDLPDGVTVTALDSGVAPVPARLLDRYTLDAAPRHRGRARLRVCDDVTALRRSPAARCEAVCATLARLCATAPPPEAIAFYPSRRWVDPETFLDRRPGSPFGAQPLYGVVNVRRFSDGLDTVGLAPLGWPDLQLLTDRDPRAAAATLYLVADALFRGERIIDGTSLRVDGHRLRFAPAPCLRGPWRRVWDLRPQSNDP